MQVQSAVVRRTSERKTPNMTKNMLTSHYDIMDDVARKFPEGAQARMESSRESHQMAIVSGILLAYLSNWLLSFLGPVSRRWMFATAGVPSVVLFIGLLFRS
jgi:hypothetical protein